MILEWCDARAVSVERVSDLKLQKRFGVPILRLNDTHRRSHRAVRASADPRDRTSAEAELVAR
jgi:hypothetical protein